MRHPRLLSGEGGDRTNLLGPSGRATPVRKAQEKGRWSTGYWVDFLLGVRGERGCSSVVIFKEERWEPHQQGQVAKVCSRKGHMLSELKETDGKRSQAADTSEALRYSRTEVTPSQWRGPSRRGEALS